MGCRSLHHNVINRVTSSFPDFQYRCTGLILLEATYQVQIRPGFFIQPDFQYVFHPGGAAARSIR